MEKCWCFGRVVWKGDESKDIKCGGEDGVGEK